MTPVTLVPITALMSVEPVPLPELVIVPVLLRVVPDTVIPLAVALLFLRVRLPVPVVPPDRVNSAVPLLLVRVVPPMFTFRRPLIVSAELVLFSVMPVTFDPTAAL